MLKKRFLAMLLAIAMILSLIASLNVNADAAIINDLEKSSSYAKGAIEYLAEQSVIEGEQSGNFNPQKYVTRAEMVALLSRVFGLDTTQAVETATFSDVPKENWANPYVEAAFKAGIVTGVSTTEFKPKAQITREQMAVMFVRALKLIDSDVNMELKNLKDFQDMGKVAAWAQKEVEVALEAELMNGMSSIYFEPKKNARKEQAAVVIERLMKNKESITQAFKTPTVEQGAVKLFVNGESVILKPAALVRDGVLYLPVEFFNRYIAKADEIQYSGQASEVKFVLKDHYKQMGVSFLWLHADNKTAFINEEAYPFGNTELYKDKAIFLEHAPITADGFMYLPLKDMAKILDIEYNYSEAANELNIIDESIGESANLYYALKKHAYTNYIGEIRAKGVTEVRDVRNSYTAEDSFDMRDRMVTPYEGEYFTRYSLRENGDTTYIIDDHVIVLNDRYYTKDFNDNMWVKEMIVPYASFIAVSLYNPLYDNADITQRNMNRIMFDNISKMDIRNAGTVNISGINAVKYVIELNLDSIKNTMTAEEYAELRPMLEKELRGDFRYIHEYYVANEKIIKQGYTFIGEFKDLETGEPIDAKSFVEMYFNKLPRDFKVIEPTAAEVKTVIEQ